MNITSQKLYADSAGQETPADYQGDYIDVFSAEDKDENGRKRTNPLYLEKHKLAQGEHSITLKSAGRAGKSRHRPTKLID